MELVITALYILFIWLCWYKWKWLKVTIFWKIVWPSLWVVAITLEVIALGQFCPYSKNAFVWTYVYQIGPEYGGIVTEVNVQPNTPIKKGDQLFQMDPKPWEYKVAQYTAAMAAAKQDVLIMSASVDEAKADVEQVSAQLVISEAELKQYTQAAKSGATSQIRLEQSTETVMVQRASLKKARAAQRKAELSYHAMVDGVHVEVAQIQAQLDEATFNLSQRSVLAPADGYVVDLNLQAGVELRLKKPVMTFIDGNLNEYWVVAKLPQFGMKRVKSGDAAEVMLEMYPGEVFAAEVVDVVWATGAAQLQTDAQLPDLISLEEDPSGDHFYMVKLVLVNRPEGMAPRFGAVGKAAIYPKSAPDILIALRKIELRMDSWISYLYL
jgi:multidrug resistance efflux pump